MAPGLLESGIIADACRVSPRRASYFRAGAPALHAPCQGKTGSQVGALNVSRIELAAEP